MSRCRAGSVDNIGMKEYLNVNGISQAEAAKFETLFKLLDSDDRGGINEEELADLMPRMGVFLSHEELHGLFVSVDVDGSGEIDFAEFLQLMAQHREEAQLQLLEGGGEAYQQLKRAARMKDAIPADHPLSLGCDILVTVALFIACTLLVYEDIRGRASPNALGARIFCFVVYTLDIARGFVTSVDYTNLHKLPVDDRKLVARAYLKSTRFKIDLLSWLPADFILDAVGVSTAALVARHLRLVKFFAVPGFFLLTPRDIFSTHLARFYYAFLPLLKMLYTMLLVVHLLAMVWILLHPASDDVTWITAVYFILQTLTTTGFGDIAVTEPRQKIYCVFLFCCASVVTGLVVGKLVAISQQADLQTDAHQVMLETLAALNHLTIPNDFKEEVLAFQLHRLKHSNSLFNDAISGLPQCMQDRMALYARMKIVRQVPIFAEASDICVAKLAQSLVNVFAPPEEYIVIAGEEGEEMFFLFHGMCGVSLANGKWVATIKRGGVFGEVALLEATRRSASIKSLTYCQLFRLDKLAFEAIVAKFPILLESIKKVSVALQMRLKSGNFKPSAAGGAGGGEAKATNAITAAPDNAPQDLLPRERSRAKSMVFAHRQESLGVDGDASLPPGLPRRRVSSAASSALSDASSMVGALAGLGLRRSRMNSLRNIGGDGLNVIRTRTSPALATASLRPKVRTSMRRIPLIQRHPSSPEIGIAARVDKIVTVMGHMVYEDLVKPPTGVPPVPPPPPPPAPPPDAPT